MIARSEGIDIPDNSQRYAHRYTFYSDPSAACHIFSHVEVAEPCKLRTVDLQVLLPPGIAYTDATQHDILNKIGASISFRQVVQVKLPDTTIRRALHIAVDPSDVPKLLESNLAQKGLPEETQVGYLCPIVHVQIPQRAYDNPSECPMEHWQAYAQRFGAPVTRLPIANPLHLNDQAGRKRASQCCATSNAAVNGILSSECVPFAALVTPNVSIKAEYFAQPVPECLQRLEELTETLLRAYDTRITPHLQALITAGASSHSKMVPAVHQANSGYVIWHCQGKGTVTVPQYRLDQHQAHVICPNGDVVISVFFEALLILPSKKGPGGGPEDTPGVFGWSPGK